jgi:hypothetical protein
MSRIRIFGLLAIGLCSAALWGQDSNGSLRGIVQNSTRSRIQGTLPSTGLSDHNTCLNLVISHQYAFTPTVVSNLTLSGGVCIWHTRGTQIWASLLASPSVPRRLQFQGLRHLTITSSPLRSHPFHRSGISKSIRFGTTSSLV